MFTRTDRRHPARDAPRSAGLNAVAIHSDRSQPERMRALEGFKTGDAGAGGDRRRRARLDIEDLPVVNFELPWNPQDYIHRIGRTGRAGATGEAISLVTMDEADCAASSACAGRSRGPSRMASCRSATPSRVRSAGCQAGGRPRRITPITSRSATGRQPGAAGVAEAAGSAGSRSVASALRLRLGRPSRRPAVPAGARCPRPRREEEPA